MSGIRIILLLGCMAVAAAASVHFAARLRDTLDLPQAPTTTPSGTPHRSDTPPRKHRRTDRSHRTQRQPPRRSAGPDGGDRTIALGLTGAELAVLVAIEIGVGVVSLTVLGVGLVVRRVRLRTRRDYRLYELHLSTHDEAKTQDLEDMIEAIANVVRAFPADRARYGQPYVAIELIYGANASGDMEWWIGVRCQPSVAGALDGAISAAYHDVRLGHAMSGSPQHRPGLFPEPGHVMRFRKERSFIYGSVASEQQAPASPPLEQIAHSQAALDVPSIVRFQLTPAPVYFEALARALYKRHENKLVRQERWGLPEGGLQSMQNRAEMTNAQRSQNSGLFWLEVTVAADSRETCKPLAAAVQSRRGENRLHRRWMIVRQNLYRRRFPRALGPLVPSPRTLFSASEVAHLLALPSAQMKGVPVRRVAIPRIPMSPEIMRATGLEPIATPAPVEAT
jgi:hypothetical protein